MEASDDALADEIEQSLDGPDLDPVLGEQDEALMQELDEAPAGDPATLHSKLTEILAASNQDHHEQQARKALDQELIENILAEPDSAGDAVISVANRKVIALDQEPEMNMYMERAMHKDEDGVWPLRSSSYWAQNAPIDEKTAKHNESMLEQALSREKEMRAFQIQKKKALSDEEEHRIYLSGVREKADLVQKEHEEAMKQERLDKLLPYTDRSLCCLTRENCVRRLTIAVIEHPSFDSFFLGVIFVNCIALAMYDPYDTDCEKGMCQILEFVELGIMALFCLELSLKVVAMGFYGNGSYLDSAWNRLDLFIILASAADMFAPSSMGLSLFRAFRLLRPLRAIQRLPELRMLVATIIETLPMLGSGLAVVSMIFLMFSIIGVQLFAGVLHQRCTDSALAVYPRVYNDGAPFYCSLASQGQHCPDTSAGALAIAPTFSVCSKDAGSNPGGGTVSFDNTLQAWLAILEVVTMEGWVVLSNALWDATSPWSYVYFVVLIIVGQLLVVKLFVSIVACQYAKTKRIEAEVQKIIDAKRAEFDNERQRGAILHAGELGMDMCATVGNLLRTAGLYTEAKGVTKLEAEITAAHAEADYKMMIICTQLGKNVVAELHAASKDGQVPGRVAGAKAIESTIKGMEYCLHTKAEAHGLIYKCLKCIFPELGACKEKWTAYWAAKFHDSDGCGMCLRSADEAFQELRVWIEKPFFMHGILFAILLNTIVLASESYGQSPSLTATQSALNLLFTGIFALELMVKLMAYGWGYFDSKMNQFDAFVVFSSIVELTLSVGISLAGLRGFRLLRLFRVARWLPGMAKQLEILARIIMFLFNYLVVLFLFLFIFAVLGVYLFGARTNDHPEAQFDNTLEAFVTVFRLLSLDNWTETMTICVDATAVTAVLFFVSIVCLGNLILRSVFIAILLEAFAEVTDEEEEALVADFNDRCQLHDGAVAKIKEALQAVRMGLRAEMFKWWKESTKAQKEIDELVSAPATTSKLSLKTAATALAIAAPKKKPREVPENKKTNVKEANVKDKRKENRAEAAKSDKQKLEEQAERCQNLIVGGSTDSNSMYRMSDDKAFFIFPSNGVGGLGSIRTKCRRWISSVGFERTILAAIYVSSLLIAVDNPSIEETSALGIILTYGSLACTCLFTFEMAVKMIAKSPVYTRVRGEISYIQDPWNVMDFLLVVFALLDVFMTYSSNEDSPLSALKVFRMLRAARPLRFVSRMKTLKRVVSTIAEAAAPLAYTVLIAATLLLMFAIFGVNLLKGKFYWCPADPSLGQDACDSGLANGTLTRGWVARSLNFDDTPEAMLTLFFVAMGWGWGHEMRIAIDSSEIGVAPEKDASPLFAVYFVIWYIVGNFMLFNIFVGVLADSYQRVMVIESASIKGDEDDIHLGIAQARTVCQQTGVEAVLAAQKAEDRQEDGTALERQSGLFAFVTDVRFDMGMNVAILLNLVAMAVEHYQQPDLVTAVLGYLEYVFIGIFTLEALLKACGMGCSRYWSSNWNRLDLFLVGLALLQVIMESIGDILFNTTILRTLRLLRIARMLRLLRSAEGIQALLSAIEAAFVQIANVLLLLSLLWFIFAAAGVELFGKIECPNVDYPCEGLNQRTNFKNIGKSSLALLQIFSGDTARQIFEDTARIPPQCDDSPACKYGDNCCASAGLSAFFFVSFGLLAQLILVNVIVAMILSSLAKSMEATYARDLAKATGVVNWEDAKLKRMADVIETELVDPRDALQQAEEEQEAKSPKKLSAKIAPELAY